MQSFFYLQINTNISLNSLWHLYNRKFSISKSAILLAAAYPLNTLSIAYHTRIHGWLTGDSMNDVSSYLWLEACCCRCQEASSSRTLPGVRGRGALQWAGQCAGSKALATPALKTRPRNLINRNLIKKQTGKRLGSFLSIFSCTSLHLILNIKLVFWDISRNVLSSFAGSFRFD